MNNNPSIIQRSAFTVIGMRMRGTKFSVPKDAPAIWERLMVRSGEIVRRVNPCEAFGVIGNSDFTTGEFDYLAGFEVSDTSRVPKGMEVWHIPACTYAVFPCTLPTLIETFGYIYSTWFPQSGRERGDGPEFELYDEEFNHHDGNSHMKVYIPVR